jgi:8-oxo-dGTP pyrophosphatase MutT (NUDIX family)/type II secretory pathway pseudopilin PulG
MKKESSAGAVIFFQKNNKREYLLLNYIGGHWGFPKGHIELNENPIKTALREIKEETGLDVKIFPNFERKITYSFYHKGEFVIKDVIFYLAKAKSQKVTLSDEHKGYVWLPYQRAYQLITYEKNILKGAENFLNKIQINSDKKNKTNKFGFTLVEILLVISMILIIFAVTSQIFQPLTYFQKIRDTKRLSDMQALNIALNTYLMTATSLNLGPSNKAVNETNPTIFISVPFDKEDIRSQTITFNSKTYYFSQVSSTNVFKNNGQGWLPIDLTALANPTLFAYPVDPINSYNKKLFYAYVFKRSSSSYEINTKLEYSNYQKNAGEDQVSTDFGDNQDILEIGNDKTLMPNNLF